MTDKSYLIQLESEKSTKIYYQLIKNNKIDEKKTQNIRRIKKHTLINNYKIIHKKN